MAERSATRVPTCIGHAGLWTSAAGLAACLGSVAVGWTRIGTAGPPAEGSAAAWILGGLLLAPVAVLGLALFRGFLRLPDWTAAPDVPLGVKLLGHLGRVLGSLCAAACVALAVLTVVVPDGVPRPGLAGLYTLGIFVGLAVRLLGVAIAEARRWARWGSLVCCGAALAAGIVLLVLNAAVWHHGSAAVALSAFCGVTLALFLFLSIYVMRPAVASAFEAGGL
jgi:hypothetical protein